MSDERYRAADLKRFLVKSKISTITELQDALGTSVRMTVFRKLAELGYQTSYSHNGRFYALKSLCEFNGDGLWSCQDVWFSVYGTLLETGRNFIGRSSAGYSVNELDEALHVSTKQSLLHLNKKSMIAREKVGGIYVYFSADEGQRKRQLLARGGIVAAQSPRVDEDMLAHELKAAIILFYSVLDERQRRFFAGLESIQMGRGGDARVARLLGIDPHTVAKGRSELLERDLGGEGVRKRGSGRNRIEKKLRK